MRTPPDRAEVRVMPTMPAQTQRAHSDPSWVGDRLGALDDVARQGRGPDGIIAADRNFQWAWHDPRFHSRGGAAYCLHWEDPHRNNYRHILEAGGKRTRPMTRAELGRSITRWRASDVRRWRRTSSIHSERPPTYVAMARKAVAVGVVITAELKSNAFAEQLPARQIVNAAKRAGHPPYFMALYGSMPLCRQKCQAIVRAGGQFAVIFGNWQYLRKGRFAVAVKFWNPKPTRTW